MTAAAQGIGRTTAFAFAAEGASVLATDIAEDKLSPLADALISTRHPTRGLRPSPGGLHPENCPSPWVGHFGQAPSDLS